MTLDLTSPTAILALAPAEARQVFAGDPDTIRSQWRAAAARWHPDRHAGDACATAVFRHLLMLRDAALRETAGTSGELRLMTMDGREFRLRYLRRRAFELGEAYLGRRTVAFALTRDNLDLFEAACETIDGLRFESERMRAQFTRSLPIGPRCLETTDRLVMVHERPPGMVLLGDLVDHLGGRLEPRHIAWVVSGLANIACYLATQELMHGAIDTDTVLVDPATHGVALLGGWFYATPVGAPLRALPSRAADLLPPAVLEAGIAVPRIDLTLIRGLACALVGDPSGSRVEHEGLLPRPFARWATHPPAEHAFADYATWEAAREASFGPRRFARLSVDPADIYPQARSNEGV